MPTSTITFRSSLRDKAKKKAKKMGIPLSFVLNQAIKDFLQRDDRIAFGLTENGFTPEQEEEILQAEKEINEGKISGPFHSAKEFIEHLHKESKKYNKK